LSFSSRGGFLATAPPALGRGYVVFLPDSSDTGF
jgi:hypothetical protein